MFVACSDLPGLHTESVLFGAVLSLVFRAVLTHNNCTNLVRVFVKEANWPCMFSAWSDESSRPVNAYRFVLVFLMSFAFRVGLKILVRFVGRTIEGLFFFKTPSW